MGSKVTWIVILSVVAAVVFAAPEGKKEEKEASAIPTTPAAAATKDENSHCPDATCTPAPKNHKCEAKYERDDHCCPVWHCDHGETVYGIQKTFGSGSGTGGSSSSSYSFSSSKEDDTTGGTGGTGGGRSDPWAGFGSLSRRFFNHSSFFDDF